MRRSALKHFPWASTGIPESGEILEVKYRQQREFGHLLHTKPKISLILSPLRGSFEHAHLEETLESIVTQTYGQWELLIPYRGPADWVTDLQRKYPDARCRWISTETKPVAVIKNEMVEQSTGDYIGILDWTDVLSPSTLYFMVMSLQGDGDTDLLVTNEARIDPDSSRSFRFLSKPDQSWFDLIHFNYIGRFWVAKRKFYGVFSPLFVAEHEYDFLLRLQDAGARMRTIPLFLYYRRHLLEPDWEERCDIVEGHLERRGIAARVWKHEVAGKTHIKVSPEIAKPAEESVSVIVCFKNKADMTIKCLTHLRERLGQCPVEILVINNQSEIAERAKVAAYVESLPGIARLFDYEHAFNFAHMHNWAVKEHARGKYIFLLNNDVFVQSPFFVDEMVRWAQFEKTGTVGALLRYPDGSIQYGGLTTLFGSFTRLARIYHVQDERGFPYENKEAFGNTFAACLVKRSTFDDVGGLRELELSNGFGDVAFNFACLRKGYHHYYLGHIEGVHLESASRGAEYENWEYLWLEKEYPEILQRMLRFDLGYDRIPGPKHVIKEEIRTRLYRKLSRHRWLKPFSRWFEV